MKGAVAAGHEKTVEAAAFILEAGGNAFDAALAAICAACVVESVLTSLGGGGFLLARTPQGNTRMYDFFVQTPLNRRPTTECGFYPIVADFGKAQQEFHIGAGSIATPGTIRGIFDIHRQLGSLPLHRIFEPAIHYAREGVSLNRLQAYIFSIVAPIFVATAEARANYCSDGKNLYVEGDLVRQSQLADTLEQLSRDEDRLFYDGELGDALVELCRSEGGHLSKEDLRHYRTKIRVPLIHSYRHTTLHTNPPPSSGGLLIGFAQRLLETLDTSVIEFGGRRHLEHLSRVMELTNLARNTHSVHHGLLQEEILQRYLTMIRGHPVNSRGTTHISIIDQDGNIASVTLSNGEGCGYMLPGSGIMPNNMLGEEDLNPEGFNQWRENVRVSSMMAPSLVEDGKRLIAIGSGGSNRLRTAILQTLSNLIDFAMPVEKAVCAPRIHYERGLLSVEPGFTQRALQPLLESSPEYHLWKAPNLFFGGTHTVVYDGHHFSGAGDPRRGGAFRVV